MINNKKLFEDHIFKFENKGDFFHLILLKRKKDFPEEEQNEHQSVRTIKSYAIDSLETLDKRWDEITGLAEYFKARVYCSVNRFNDKHINLQMIKELVNRIESGNNNSKYIWDSVVGSLKTQEKRWIVDVDKDMLNAIDYIKIQIDLTRPLNIEKHIIEIPTKSGIHLITKPFDTHGFLDNKYCLAANIQVDIQKCNPSILYIPNSLTNE